MKKRAPLFLLVFCAGFSTMSVELASIRALAPFFGSSVFVWTNLIGVVLACLSLGYYVGGKLADRWEDGRRLALLLLLGGASTALSPFLARFLSPWFLPEGLRLEDAFSMLWGGSLAVGLLAFGAPAFLLSLTSPVAVRLLSREGKVGSSAGVVFALSTVGSILGTFLTTYLLVPLWGTRATFLLAGGVVGAAAFWLWLAERKPGGAVPVALLLYLLPAGLAALGSREPIKEPYGGETLLVEAETPYQYVQIAREGKKTVLRVNEGLDSYQSLWVEGSRWTGAYYDLFLLAPLLAEKEEGEALDVLVLGLGGGTASRQFHDWFAGRHRLRVDGVEIDPALLEAAREPFRLLPTVQPGLRVLSHGDARVAVERLGGLYDVVLLDVYSSQIHIPFHLATEEFFRAVHRRLRDGGVFAANVGLLGRDDPTVRLLAETAAVVFGELRGVPVRDTRNEVLFARKGKALPEFETLHDRNPLPELRFLLGYAAVPEVAKVYGPAESGSAWSDDRCPVEVLQALSLWRGGRR